MGPKFRVRQTAYGLLKNTDFQRISQGSLKSGLAYLDEIHPRRESSSLKLAECEKRIHEMKFYFPLPDSRMPFTLLGTEDSQVSGTERLEGKSGFLNGSIDLVFEWEGRVYLLDWKSNLLENYSKQRLAEAV